MRIRKKPLKLGNNENQEYQGKLQRVIKDKQSNHCKNANEASPITP